MTIDVSPAPELEVIFTPEDIAHRLGEIARQIAAGEAEGLLVVAILKGSFVFAADLIRALHGVGMAPEVDFMTLSSYRKSRVSSGQVSILRDMDLEVRGRNVLIVDDVLDSGRTLAFAKDLIAARGAPVHQDVRAPRQAGETRRQPGARLLRVRVSGHFRRRLRHGRCASLPRASLRRPRRA